MFLPTSIKAKPQDIQKGTPVYYTGWGRIGTAQGFPFMLRPMPSMEPHAVVMVRFPGEWDTPAHYIPLANLNLCEWEG